ncbi:hypothetical protein ACQR1I_15715 [Bradyrhizobium sp. HKCCYLS2038]|uniref:hypothetical protein n=1 Tax=unclassified Bradyrhizobium TaxID=2631580 RepID=UPI003EB6A2E3
MSNAQSIPDPYLPPGTAVRYDGHQDGGPEYGIVIHCWHEPEIGGYDCYVAFFGAEPPAGKSAVKPYVLRYMAMSLTVM